MPNHNLASTSHFEIVWWPGVDSRGLYISQRLPDEPEDAGATLMTKGYALLETRDIPQCFIDLDLVPSLIADLRTGDTPLMLLSRVTFTFVPGFHRQPKKNGGDPKLAYYTPLSVEGALRGELADALEQACSRETMTREEQRASDYYSLLNNTFLEDGVWRSGYGSGELLSRAHPLNTLELPAHQLAQEPKQRFRVPTGNIYGEGTILLRVASAKHRCSKSRCLDYVWIKPGNLYVEQRKGKSASRFHIKCAFRQGTIPARWLSPHFEQHHLLVEHGFQGWIDQEKEKTVEFDLEQALSRLNPQRVEEFVTLLNDGYQLDSFERGDWREFLHHTPFDIEPFASARKLVDLPDPGKKNHSS